MAQDTSNATPSTPVGTADVANASALVESVSVIRQALSTGSDAVVTAITAIATAVTQKLLGGVVGTTTNRLLKSKTVSSGTSAGSLQASGITCDSSNNLSGIGDITGATWKATVVSPVYGGTGVANNAANLLTWSGNFAATFTLTGATGVTFPTTGTLLTNGAITWTGTQTWVAGSTSNPPVKFQSGTNLTTAAVGAEEFDGVCFYATSAASSRQVVDTEQVICLSANYTLDATITTAQKAFDASSTGALTVQSSTAYVFEGLYLITNTGTNSHFWQIALGGAATFTSAQMTAIGQTATGAALFGTIGVTHTTTVGTLFAVSVASTSATENMTVLLRGVIRVNAGGTIIPQVAMNAATGGTATMLANSYFRIWPVGSNAVTNVGNWS